MPWLAVLGQIAGLMATADAGRSANNTLHDVPINFSTNRGSGITASGMATIDPRISNLRDSLISQYGALMPQVTGLYGGLLKEAGDNSDAFINASVNPLRSQVNRAWGDMVLGQERRGIRGSTFGNDAIRGFATDTGSALDDETSKAIMNSIMLRSNLGQTMFGQQQNILHGQEEFNTDALRQELAALGLDENMIGNFLQRQLAINKVRGATSAALGNGIMGLGGAIAGLGGGGGGGGLPMLGGASLSGRM